MTATRTETDTFGPIEVAADRYWGAQTQRSLQNFKIGWEKQPIPVVRALGVVKRAAAEANLALGKLDPVIAEAIVAAAQVADHAARADGDAPHHADVGGDPVSGYIVGGGDEHGAGSDMGPLPYIAAPLPRKGCGARPAASPPGMLR